MLVGVEDAERVDLFDLGGFQLVQFARGFALLILVLLVLPDLEPDACIRQVVHVDLKLTIRRLSAVCFAQLRELKGHGKLLLYCFPSGAFFFIQRVLIDVLAVVQVMDNIETVAIFVARLGARERQLCELPVQRRVMLLFLLGLAATLQLLLLVLGKRAISVDLQLLSIVLLRHAVVRLVAFVHVAVGDHAKASLVGVFENFIIDLGLKPGELDLDLLSLHELDVDVHASGERRTRRDQAALRSL